MEQSHLIELIKTLNAEEKRQILQVASQPYFNHGKMRDRVPPLLSLCFDHPWDSSTPENKLPKKSVYAVIFPGQNFLEGKLDKLMVEAHKVVRLFLLIQHYLRQENEFHQDFDFAEILRSRGLNARSRQLIAKVKKKQEEATVLDAAHFHQQFLLEYSIHNEESLRNQAKGDLNIPRVLEALDLHYHLNRLALLNRFLLQQKIANLPVADVIKPLLAEDQLPKRYLDASLAIKINLEIFNLLKKDYHEAAELRPLFDLLRSSEKYIDQESLREFYTYLRNFCALVLAENIENVEVDLMLHDLYKDNLPRGYLHNEGGLLASRYWAVTSNALRVKAFDWALAFIENHKHELIGENETQDVYHLNLANYLFAIGQYQACLDHIPASSPQVYNLLHGKRLELKALYELQSDLLSYKLDGFKMFLSRTSPKLLSATQRRIHADFANLLHQIVHSKPNDVKRSDKLVKRIRERKQAGEWRWLLEKALALKK